MKIIPIQGVRQDIKKILLLHELGQKRSWGVWTHFERFNGFSGGAGGKALVKSTIFILKLV